MGHSFGAAKIWVGLILKMSLENDFLSTINVGLAILLMRDLSKNRYLTIQYSYLYFAPKNRVMTAVKSFLVLLLLCSFQDTSAQFWYKSAPDPARTEADMQKSIQDLHKAYDAYNEGDLEKTRYYLDQSEKKGYVSDAFYYLLGQWCFDVGKYSAAKRYWMRGYDKHGCWECKELADERP